MFKSKQIGWITATTLLCVAGVAIACRLSDGSGDLMQASAAAWPSADDKTPPPPAPTEATPAPLPVPDPTAPPTPKTKLPPPPPDVAPLPPPLAAVPAPSPVAAVPVKEEEKKPESSKPMPCPVSALPTPPPESGTSPIVPVPVEDKAVPDPTPISTIPLPETSPAIKPVAEKAAGSPVAPVPPQEYGGSFQDCKSLPKPTRTVVTPVENKTYWAGRGESLRDIARKTLGTEDRWREIEKLNPELRSHTLIPVNTMVRLPADADNVATVPAGGQSESEYVAPGTRSSVKPLPVVREKPEAGKRATPLTGSYECKIDGAHGFVLPKEVCDQMGKCETMFLTPGPDRCLWLVSQTGAARVLHRVEKAQVGDAEVQAFRRLYFSQTEKASVDSAGRLTVPDKLMEYAGLHGEVVLIGTDDHFEVWEATRWHRYSQEKGSTPQTPRSTDE